MRRVLVNLGRVFGVHVEQPVDNGANALEDSTPAVGASPFYLFGISVPEPKPIECDAIRTKLIISLERSK